MRTESDKRTGYKTDCSDSISLKNAYKEGKEILEWTKALIQFRQNNKILHMPQSLTLSDRVSCGYPDISYHGTNAWYAQMNTYDRHLGIMYSCVYGDEEDHSLIYAAYNLSLIHI